MEENHSEESFDNVEEDDFAELKKMNKEQVEQKFQKVGEDEFEKEGFEEGDFEEVQPGEMEGMEYEGDFIPTAANDMDINTEMMDTADNQILEMKIQNMLKLLSNFTALRDPEISREEYVSELKELYCRLFGYNAELMELLVNLFGPHEVRRKIKKKSVLYF